MSVREPLPIQALKARGRFLQEMLRLYETHQAEEKPSPRGGGKDPDVEEVEEIVQESIHLSKRALAVWNKVQALPTFEAATSEVREEMRGLLPGIERELLDVLVLARMTEGVKGETVEGIEELKQLAAEISARREAAGERAPSVLRPAVPSKVRWCFRYATGVLLASASFLYFLSIIGGLVGVIATAFAWLMIASLACGVRVYSSHSASLLAQFCERMRQYTANEEPPYDTQAPQVAFASPASGEGRRSDEA